MTCFPCAIPVPRKSISYEREVSKATPFTQASLQPSMASQFLGTKSRLSSRPWTLAFSHSSQLHFPIVHPGRTELTVPQLSTFPLALASAPASPAAWTAHLPKSIPCWSFLPQREHHVWQELLLDSP